MSADKWAAAGVAGTGVVVAAWVAVYVNGPWRKRIVDEIAMLNAATDPLTRARLALLIDEASARYARRRIRSTWVLIGIGVAMVLFTAGTVTLMFSGYRAAALIVLAVVYVGVAVGSQIHRERAERNGRPPFHAAMNRLAEGLLERPQLPEDGITTARSSSPRPAPKTRRH